MNMPGLANPADPQSSPFNPPVPMNPLQMAAQQMMLQMPPQLPPSSQWPLARGKPFTKDFIDRAKEFIGWEMEASSKLIQLKQVRWKLIKQMFAGEVGHHDLVRVLANYSERPNLIHNPRWQSDFLISCAPIISSYTDRMFGQLFSSAKKYWEISLIPSQEESIEDPLKPTSEKLQAFLTQKNTEWQFFPENYRQIQELVAMGHVYAKIFYHKETKYIARRMPGTGQIVEVPVVVEYPQLRMIPGDMILPDYSAENSDVQTWTGIGHRTYVPYSLVLQRFNEGIYNLNREEFERGFKEARINTSTIADRIWTDKDVPEVLDYSRKSMLTLWEWHGAVPLEKGGFQEVISSSITFNPDDPAHSGVWVRLDHGPALPISAGRPFMGSQFTHLPSPFGKGAVEANFDVIYYMSDILNQVIDNARLTVNANYKVRAGSQTANRITSGLIADLISPGKAHIVADMDEIQMLEPMPLNASTNIQLMNILDEQLKRASNVSPNTLAVPGETKTAYESNQLRQMADVPLQSRLTLYVATGFEPFGDRAIELLQINVDTDQKVGIPGPDNTQVMFDLPLPELRTGRYKVTATLGNEDNMRVAKMQTMQQAMPLILQSDQWSIADGKQVDKFGLFLEFLKLCGVEDLSRYVTDIPPEQQQALQMLKSLPPEMLQMLIQQAQQMMQGPPPGQGVPPEGGPGPQQIPQGPNPTGDNRPEPDGYRAQGSPLAPGDNSDFGRAVMQLQLEANARGGMQS